jgi:hypothetical protein
MSYQNGSKDCDLFLHYIFKCTENNFYICDTHVGYCGCSRLLFHFILLANKNNFILYIIFNITLYKGCPEANALKSVYELL